ncbi:unnamed protein product, partial [Nippostrongylus brasiliensis]|uniref:SUN domain-containing protein n=1 Tax=Nippostrongylus brasiliensis TaxID=27835 RepID=A0A0N4XIT4_NIPBR
MIFFPGAFVVPHLTSRAVASGSMLYNLVDAVIGLETYNLAITERTHITPSEAFCFEGAEGKLTIRLWTNASVEAVEYEHDYWSSVVPISAPDLYDVKACLDSECEQAVLLAQCRYPNDVREGPVQVCTMQEDLKDADKHSDNHWEPSHPECPTAAALLLGFGTLPPTTSCRPREADLRSPPLRSHHGPKYHQATTFSVSVLDLVRAVRSVDCLTPEVYLEIEQSIGNPSDLDCGGERVQA